MEPVEIDDVVCRILIKDGPDGHVDGHDVITDFVVALLEGSGEEWAARYDQKLSGGWRPYRQS